MLVAENKQGARTVTRKNSTEPETRRSRLKLNKDTRRETEVFGRRSLQGLRRNAQATKASASTKKAQNYLLMTSISARRQNASMDSTRDAVFAILQS